MTSTGALEALRAMNSVSLHQTNRATSFPVHPLTCGNDSSHTPLYPYWDGEKVTLICRDCDYTQGNAAMFSRASSPPPVGDDHTAAKASLLVLASLRDIGPEWSPALLKDIDFAIEACRAALSAVQAGVAEGPVAWMFELATHVTFKTGKPSRWGKPQLSFNPPRAGKLMRNVTPLYTAPPPPVAAGGMAPVGWRDLLAEAQQLLTADVAEAGGCDHSVGICWCDYHSLIARISKALASPSSPAEEER